MDGGVISRLVRGRPGSTIVARRLQPAAAKAARDRVVASRDVLPRSDAPPSARGFRVERRFAPDYTILAPVGELDESATGTFQQAFDGVRERGQPIVIDLRELSFIDSCGLWSITTTYSACRQAGIDVSLWRGPERVQEVFEVTGVCDLLRFTDRPVGTRL